MAKAKTLIKVFNLGGSSYDVPLDLTCHTVADFQEKLETISGIWATEQKLFFEGVELNRQSQMGPEFRESEAVLFLIRKESAASRAFSFYQKLLESMRVVERNLSDWEAHANCGLCFYNLGEKQQAWDSYKLAVQARQSFSSQVSDDQLLADPKLGNIFRTLKREWQMNRWPAPPVKDRMDLFAHFVLERHAGDLFRDHFPRLMPNFHSAVHVMFREKLQTLLPPPRTLGDRYQWGSKIDRRFSDGYSWDPAKRHLLEGEGTTGNDLYLILPVVDEHYYSTRPPSRTTTWAIKAHLILESVVHNGTVDIGMQIRNLSEVIHEFSRNPPQQRYYRKIENGQKIVAKPRAELY